MCNSRVEIDWLFTGKKLLLPHPPYDKDSFHLIENCHSIGYRIPDSSHRKKQQSNKKRWSHNCHGQTSPKWYRTNQKSIHIRMSIRWVAEHFLRFVYYTLIFAIFHRWIQFEKKTVSFFLYFFSHQHWLLYVLNYRRQPVSEDHLFRSIHLSMSSIASNYLIVSITHQKWIHFEIVEKWQQQKCHRFHFNYFRYTASPAPNGVDNGCDVKLFDLAKSVHWIVDDSAYSGDGLKRKMLPGMDDSDDETPRPPPAQDIYRLRQQKRFNKQWKLSLFNDWKCLIFCFFFLPIFSGIM